MAKLDAFEQTIKYVDKKEKIMKNIAVLKEKNGNCDELLEIEEVLK